MASLKPARVSRCRRHKRQRALRASRPSKYQELPRPCQDCQVYAYTMDLVERRGVSRRGAVQVLLFERVITLVSYNLRDNRLTHKLLLAVTVETTSNQFDLG
jgi:hypothetical protein